MGADRFDATRRWKNVSKASDKLIRGWETVIGLEIHAQVASNSKLFSGASTVFGGEPNSHVSLVDAAMPGMLPVINEECVRQAVRTGLGLNAKINLRSVFDRKNYFYPDSPQGYQISQYKSPIVGEGEVTVELGGGKTATIGIERLHLEQDAAKLLHDQSPLMSYVDLNRAGVALMEIVSKPDIRDAEQAKAYLIKLRSILRYLGTCDGDMEKGSLRADVNVSVRKPGGPLGTRCEIKNMNSIAFIGQAIEYEARRQIGILQAARQLGDQRIVRGAQQGRPGHLGIAGVGRTAWGNRRSDRRGHDLRQDRQGSVRDRVAGGRRPPRAGRNTRHEAGHGPGHDREGGRRHHRRQSRQGRTGARHTTTDRLVRRPGDEVIRRQGQSASRQRSAQVQTRHLTSARCRAECPPP